MKLSDILIYSFIAQYLIAFVVYMKCGDYGRAMYWISAMLISFSTLIMR